MGDEGDGDGKGFAQNGALDANAASLAERGRKAHASLIPMSYIFPVMEMLKNKWWVSQHQGKAVQGNAI
jgi:hypothetical protein